MLVVSAADLSFKVTLPVQALPACHHALTVLQLYPRQCQVPIAGIAKINCGGESCEHFADKGCEALKRVYASSHKLCRSLKAVGASENGSRV